MADPDSLPTIPFPRPVADTKTAPNQVPAAADDKALIAGKYRLVEKLGEGGMGAVWRAEQMQPVRRMVAVKLIRGGMATDAAVARFEAERQALALMDHPHVAKVFDAGTTDAGDPFFVMEVVPGISITRFCTEKQLPLRQRLELFAQVCLAVHHAHQRGIIHRDLKPGNILVEDRDGQPVPKVIDFGLAKALGGEALSDRPDRTAVGAVMGTLLYMAPEQAGGDTAGVETRTDVFALGVILYELLTGTTPIERDRLPQMDVYEQLLAVQREEPPWPSKRLSQVRKAARAMRNEGPFSNPHSAFRIPHFYELDWVTMKALAKERDRRYASAAALADDIGRYLRDEPVEAGPPSAGYRVRKFAKRNRGPVVAGVLLLLALIGGAIGTTIGMLRARAANEESRWRLGLVEKGNEVLVSAFRDLDPRATEKGGPPLQAQLGDRLDEAADLLEAESLGDPLASARLQFALGVAQFNLGHPARAERLFARAAEARRVHLGPDDPLTLAAQNGLARAYRGLGRPADAAALLEQVVARAEVVLGPDDDVTLSYRTNLAGAYRDLKRPGEAAELHLRVLRVREARHGPNHRDTVTSRHNLATCYIALGRDDEAVPLLERVIKAMETLAPPDHPDTLASRNELAEAYRGIGRVRDAVRLHTETVDRFEATLGPTDPRTLIARNNLAATYLADGRVADAARLHERTLQLSVVRRGADHPDTLIVRNNLAAAYNELDRVADAAKLFEETLRLAEARLPLDHPLTLATRSNLAVTYRALDRAADAARLLEDTVKLCEARKHPNTLTVRLNLAETYEVLGEYAKAEPIYRDAVDMHRSKFGPADRRTMVWTATLGVTLLRQQKFVEAEPLLLSAYCGLKEREKNLSPTGRNRFRETGEGLAQLYEATNRPAEAAKLWAELPREVAPPRAVK